MLTDVDRLVLRVAIKLAVQSPSAVMAEIDKLISGSVPDPFDSEARMAALTASLNRLDLVAAGRHPTVTASSYGAKFEAVSTRIGMPAAVLLNPDDIKARWPDCEQLQSADEADLIKVGARTADRYLVREAVDEQLRVQCVDILGFNPEEDEEEKDDEDEDEDEEEEDEDEEEENKDDEDDGEPVACERDIATHTVIDPDKALESLKLLIGTVEENGGCVYDYEGDLVPEADRTWPDIAAAYVAACAAVGRPPMIPRRKKDAQAAD